MHETQEIFAAALEITDAKERERDAGPDLRGAMPGAGRRWRELLAVQGEAEQFFAGLPRAGGAPGRGAEKNA